MGFKPMTLSLERNDSGVTSGMPLDEGHSALD
jgi:hypothetical protein